MAIAQHYDLLVIGARAAGSTAASTTASHGKKVALIERDSIGGTCLNYGCDPGSAHRCHARKYIRRHASFDRLPLSNPE